MPILHSNFLENRALKIMPSSLFLIFNHYVSCEDPLNTFRFFLSLLMSPQSVSNIAGSCKVNNDSVTKFIQCL